VQQLRFRLLEKVCSNTQLNLELVQTQSSLLLANAQIQRQKVEIEQLRSKSKRQMRRPESFHGQELLIRHINDKISFLLPFKLQGERSSKSQIDSSQHDLRDMLLYEDGQELAVESMKLMEKASGLLGLRTKIPISPVIRNLRSGGGHDPPNSYSDYRNLRLREKQLNSFGSSNNSTMSFNVSNRNYSNHNNNRPSSLVWHNQQENTGVGDGRRRSFYESNMTFHNSPPIESQEETSSKENPPKFFVGGDDKKVPLPIRLGNQGQVKSLAAVFNRKVSGPTVSQSSNQNGYTKNPSKIPIKNDFSCNLPNNYKFQTKMMSSAAAVKKFQASNFEKSSSPETATVIQNVSKIPQCRKCCGNFGYCNITAVPTQSYGRKQILTNKQKSLSPPKQRLPSTPTPPPPSTIFLFGKKEPNPPLKFRRQ
uniref:Uncharacterized protein n=1 Tax=Romanomermis culicivorax TaxID=13658 RepID=A0A915HPP7_ROMCU